MHQPCEHTHTNEHTTLKTPLRKSLIKFFGESRFFTMNVQKTRNAITGYRKQNLLSKQAVQYTGSSLVSENITENCA